jgi:ferredoxin
VPRIVLEPSRRVIDVPRGTLLIAAIRDAGLPIARPCGEALVCGRCAVRVLEGSVPEESPVETSIKQRNRVQPEQRLACAIRVRGDLVITADYWGPHP